VCVGPLLYGLALGGAFGGDFTITLIECFVFASLIVAVDPVAVRQFSFIRCLFLAVKMWCTVEMVQSEDSTACTRCR